MGNNCCMGGRVSQPMVLKPFEEPNKDNKSREKEPLLQGPVVIPIPSHVVIEAPRQVDPPHLHPPHTQQQHHPHPPHTQQQSNDPEVPRPAPPSIVLPSPINPPNLLDQDPVPPSPSQVVAPPAQIPVLPPPPSPKVSITPSVPEPVPVVPQVIAQEEPVVVPQVIAQEEPVAVVPQVQAEQVVKEELSVVTVTEEVPTVPVVAEQEVPSTEEIVASETVARVEEVPTFTEDTVPEEPQQQETPTEVVAAVITEEVQKEAEEAVTVVEEEVPATPEAAPTVVTEEVQVEATPQEQEPAETPAEEPEPEVEQEPAEVHIEIPVDATEDDLKAMFKNDPEGGVLEKDDLQAILEGMGITDTQVHEFLWDQYDIDGNGTVDFLEFSQMMEELKSIKQNFEAADVNGDKSISHLEMVGVLNNLGIDMEAKNILAITKLFDANEDAEIDFAEFLPLSIFLTTCQYHSLSKNVVTKWLRPLVSGDIAKEEVVALKLQDLLDEYPPPNVPNMDAFVGIILSGVSDESNLTDESNY